MEKIIKSNHIIDEVEKVKSKISELVSSNVDVQEMVDFINAEENTIFYFDRKLKPKTESDRDTFYAWVDTGYLYKAEPIFVSLIRHNEEFSGHYVGTAKYLTYGLLRSNICNNNFSLSYNKKIKNRNRKHIEIVVPGQEKTEVIDTEMGKALAALNIEYPDKEERCEKEIEREELTTNAGALTDITEEIFNNLLFPSWHSIHGLDRYIKIIGKRVEQLIGQGKTEYYIVNKCKYVVVNSGLMNYYGQDYKICYRYSEKTESFVAYKVMTSKQDYLDCGFTKEQTGMELTPICFLSEDESFNPSKDDFDLNTKSLQHIIEERLERFPESIRGESAAKIKERLVVALDRGICMQQRDRTYARYIYSGKDGKISWVMPLHINRALTQEPELVMTIRKMGDFYEVKTVLPYDECIKDRITAMSLYRNIW